MNKKIERISSIECLMIIFTMWTSFYMITAGALFWLDHFSVLLCFGLSVGLTALASAAFFRKVCIDLGLNALKQYTGLFVILLCALPLIIPKYEYFGMGQDEGVYQTQAIQYIYNYNDLQHDFQEYQSLNSEKAKADYAVSLEEDLIGLYNYDTELPGSSEMAEKSPVSAIYHGIPSFAALLALAGKVLGYRHMSQIQTLFYIASIILAFMILVRLNVKKTVLYVSTILFAFSPLVLWGAKSALTEIGLTCLFLGFIYFMMYEKTTYMMASALCVCAFGFYHFTIYTMLPVFIAIYLIRFFYTGHKNYLVAAVLSTTGSTLGIMFTLRCAATYAYVYNLWPIYNLSSLIRAENTELIFMGCAGVVILVCAAAAALQKHRHTVICILDKVKYPLYRVAMIAVIPAQIRILIKYRERYAGCVNTFRHLTLMGYAMNTGLIFALIAGVIALIHVKKVFNDQNQHMIGILAVYCLLIYASVMRPVVPYYYYYGRYLTPYICLVIFVGALALNLLDRKIVAAIGLMSMLCLLPYEVFFLRCKDDTRVTWQTIDTLAEAIPEDTTAVLVERADMPFYYLSLRAITGKAVYPFTQDIVSDLQQSGHEMVFISCNPELTKTLDTVCEAEYVLSEDYNLYDGSWMPFPLDATSEKRTIRLFRIK